MVVIDVRYEIKQSLWLVEKWSGRDGKWYIDGLYKLEKYAANHIATNRELLEADEVFRMRRFVEEGRTPRGSKVGGRDDG